MGLIISSCLRFSWHIYIQCNMIWPLIMYYHFHLNSLAIPVHFQTYWGEYNSTKQTCLNITYCKIREWIHKIIIAYKYDIKSYTILSRH